MIGSSPFAHVKRGPCKEIAGSPHFRSKWERNIFRVLRRVYLNSEGITIAYEQERFQFDKPYRRVADYLPDFIVSKNAQIHEIIEVKGYLDGPSKTRLKGFRKYFPDHVGKLFIYTEKRNKLWIRMHLSQATFVDYREIGTTFSRLVPWEK